MLVRNFAFLRIFADMNKLKIEYLPFASLTPSVFNSRAHSDQQVEEIAASIMLFGFNNPILIDENRNIIAGEGRYLAAKKVSRREVPVIILKNLTEAQKRAYIIADNKIALNSTWDEKKLQDEILALIHQDFSLDTIGFTNDELDEIIRGADTDNETIPVGSYERKKNSAAPPQAKIKQLAVLVICDNLEDQAEIFGQLSDQGFECKNTMV